MKLWVNRLGLDLKITDRVVKLKKGAKLLLCKKSFYLVILEGAFIVICVCHMVHRSIKKD